jgi:PST family polysaccharide transporter
VSLRDKTLQATFWFAIATYSSTAITFATTLLLARLLAPTNFGLVAIASLVINILQLFRDLGLGQALIYWQKDIEKAADAAFFLIVAMSIILFILAFLAAPFAAIFFDSETVEPLVRVLAITIVISSLNMVPSALMEKELEFKRLALPSTLSNVGYALISLPLALIGQGAWSIIWGKVGQLSIQAILVWVVSPWRPTFKFDKRVALAILKYGKYVLSASIAIFFTYNLDNAFIGKLLGATALGHYVLAFAIGSFPAVYIITLINKTILPAYSKIQDRHDLLGKAFLETLNYVLILATPITFITAILARDFINIFYGKTWEEAILPLQILSFYGLLRSAVSITGNVILVTNQVKQLNYIVYGELLLILLLGYPVITFGGLVGMSLLVSLAMLLGGVTAFVLTGKSLATNLSQYLDLIKTPAVAAIASTGVILIFRILLPFQPSVLTLIVSAAFFFTCYAGLLFAIDANLRGKVKTASLYELSRLFLK